MVEAQKIFSDSLPSAYVLFPDHYLLCLKYSYQLND